MIISFISISQQAYLVSIKNNRSLDNESVGVYAGVIPAK